jgi:hypothetical protein
VNIEDNDRGIDHGIRMRRGDRRRHHQHTSIHDLPIREGFPKGVDRDNHHDGLDFPALAGILRKNVGRPWAKVYEGIVAKAKANHGAHCWKELLDRIAWYVELNPMDVGDGQYVQASGRPFYHLRHRSDNQFLVHPVTGLLMRPKDEWTRLKFVKDGERSWWGEPTHLWQNRYFRFMNSIWYEVELVRVPQRKMTAYEAITGQRQYSSYRPRDEDWLYKLNLRDAVIRTRIYSDMQHNLALCHGYKTYDNKVVTHAEYEKERNDALRSQHYGRYNAPLLFGHYVYAKNAWQISKATMREVGLFTGPQLKLPNIVR